MAERRFNSIRGIIMPKGPKEVSVEDNNKCAFCFRKDISEMLYGKLYRVHDLVVHYRCLFFATHLGQIGRDYEGFFGFTVVDVQNEIKLASSTNCCYCSKPGATAYCSHNRPKKCQKVFHLGCGMERGSTHQFFGNFKSYCHIHRKKQPTSRKMKACDSKSCAICLDVIVPKPSKTTLWAPCCFNAWFHRDCIQTFAINAGFSFRCPMCNDDEKFKLVMKKLGIVVLNKLSVWELEPDDVGEIQSFCSAETCVCSYAQGRYYNPNSGRWSLIKCDSCGLNQTHTRCSNLQVDVIWNCTLCTEVTGRIDFEKTYYTETTPEAGPSSSNISTSSQTTRSRTPERVDND